MTQALDVRCQNCGSPLQVGEGIRFVTCTYCNTALQIVRDAATVHTEVLDKIEARTAEMSGSLKTIELQNEIERLDREWQMWREKNLGRTKGGSIAEPSPAGSMIAGLVGAGFGLFFFVATSNSGAPIFFSLFGLVFAGLAIYSAIRGSVAGSGYDEARQRYESKRTELLGELSKTKEAR